MMTVDTYQLILQTAESLFLQQGYTATSIRQIAEQVGIGKATIYHHFPDKEAIILEIVQMYSGEMNRFLAEASAQQDPLERIRLVTEISLRIFSRIVGILQIVRRELPSGRTKLQEGLLSFIGEYKRLICEALQNGVDNGTFRPLDAEKTGRVLLSMIQGTFMMSFINDQKSTVHQSAEDILQVFFQGVLAQ